MEVSGEQAVICVFGLDARLPVAAEALQDTAAAAGAELVRAIPESARGKLAEIRGSVKSKLIHHVKENSLSDSIFGCSLPEFQNHGGRAWPVPESLRTVVGSLLR
jgi:hypothetical protein